MPRIEELLIILRNHTDDAETLAEFFEAVAENEIDATTVTALRLLETAERTKVFTKLWRERNYRNALNYARARNLYAEKFLQGHFAREWCEAVLKERPWEALEVAREFNLPELAHRAAVKRSEDILASRQDVEPALEIARHERADDEDYKRRAARHAYRHHIHLRNFSSLPRLVAEFRPFFSDIEADLAEFLARAAKTREDRRYAHLKRS